MKAIKASWNLLRHRKEVCKKCVNFYFNTTFYNADSERVKEKNLPFFYPFVPLFVYMYWYHKVIYNVHHQCCSNCQLIDEVVHALIYLGSSVDVCSFCQHSVFSPQIVSPKHQLPEEISLSSQQTKTFKTVTNRLQQKKHSNYKK